jgi:hypothetical protein
MGKDLLNRHIHLASIEYFDLVVVSTIQGGFNGMWELVESIPRASEPSASKLLTQMKREIRADFRKEFESGILVPAHHCSPRRVQNSFEHILFNQGVTLYDPERDGVPQF